MVNHVGLSHHNTCVNITPITNPLSSPEGKFSASGLAAKSP
jgi:hypothetical protein